MKRKEEQPQQGAGKGRWSAKKKADAVLRLLRGEELDALSRELRLKAATLAGWRDSFLKGGEAWLKARQDGGPQEEDVRRLQAKVGEVTMVNELLEEKIRILEANSGPPPSRRSRR